MPGVTKRLRIEVMLSTCSNGIASPNGFKVQQVPQVDRRVALHLRRILLPHLERGSIAGRLHHVHACGLPRVGLSGLAGFVEPADRQHVCAVPPFGVDLFDFALDA